MKHVRRFEFGGEGNKWLVAGGVQGSGVKVSREEVIWEWLLVMRLSKLPLIVEYI